MLRRILALLLFLLLLPYALAVLYVFVPPVSMPMLADYLEGKHVQRAWVPLKDISPQLVRAVVSSEDDAFCSHFGFDFRQMEESIAEASAEHREVRATSTITQQTVKNLFLWNGHSYARKALEAPLTLWLELVWRKKRIMETYLNIAQWGDGIYGISAASRHYFGIPARALTLSQAALLATSLPDPLHRNAGRPGVNQLMLAANVMRRATTSGPELACLR